MWLYLIAAGSIAFSLWLARQIVEDERIRKKTDRKEKVERRNRDTFESDQRVLQEIHRHVNVGRYRDVITQLQQHEMCFLQTVDPSQREIYRQKLHNGLQKLLKTTSRSILFNQ